MGEKTLGAILAMYGKLLVPRDSSTGVTKGLKDDF